MDVPAHDLPALFAQLGLADSAAEIEQFIMLHSPLKQSLLLHEAEFWNPSQAAFLKEAVEEDADWVDAVNHLDTLLRAQPDV
ncbi:DUF2789 family protein [Thiomicrorhabdus sediminis]|uniref:DUF2789 domain-containing protein n=1 Tax=Thiomicrorhabdus sediminis TaxID=2580412 RepID=A0A4P9K5N7_9GAMM|nr:DUF2789 family protein [Thiomicrorhabdus sediminis]QCU90302.1 DUF2789 domain-containing protein [Thiomicrorhabdus sediminis]